MQTGSFLVDNFVLRIIHLH